MGQTISVVHHTDHTMVPSKSVWFSSIYNDSLESQVENEFSQHLSEIVVLSQGLNLRPTTKLSCHSQVRTNHGNSQNVLFYRRMTSQSLVKSGCDF